MDTSEPLNDVLSPKQTNYAVALPPCRICGESSSGYHYGANTCEACKGFFRRCLRKPKNYKCITGKQDCEINITNRAACSFCRLEKCRSKGMGRDNIKTGRYTHEKKTKDTVEIKKLQKIQLSLTPFGNYTEKQLDEVIQNLAATLKVKLPWTYNFTIDKEAKEKEFLEHRYLREEVFGSMKALSKEDYKEIYETTGLDVDGRKDMMEKGYKWFEESYIGPFVSFVKCIPGFMVMNLDDQILLVKHSIMDAYIFISYPLVNFDLGLCHLPWAEVYSMDMAIAMTYNKDALDLSISVHKRLQNLQLTYEENVILSCIAVMSCDEINISGKAIIESVQIQLVEALQLLLSRSHPQNSQIVLAKLIGILTECRTLRCQLREEELQHIKDWEDKIEIPQIYYEMLSNNE